MQTVISILIALLIFGILVLFHEYGHFIVAKKSGILVMEFSIGMGPRLFSFKKGETVYSIKALPLGGSCQMYGEDEDEEKLEKDKERAFGSKSVWKRIAVVAAGPVFNFILALVISAILVIIAGVDKPYVVDVESNSPTAEAGLKNGDLITKYDGAKIYMGRDIYLREYTTTTKPSEDIDVTYIRDGKKYNTKITPVESEKYMLGIQYSGTTSECEILALTDDSAFEEAGGKTGDVIISVNGNKITTGEEYTAYIEENPISKEEMTYILKRGKKEVEIKVTPKMTKVYQTGFYYNMGREKTSILGTIKYSYAYFRYNINMVVQSLKLIFTGKVSREEVSGPVGIVTVIGDTYKASLVDGIKYVFLNLASLTVMLSANLGVMNLLPIPALDGGRLVFLIIEAIRRKPIDREKEGFVHLIGFALLMVLMVFLFYNDIAKLIG